VLSRLVRLVNVAIAIVVLVMVAAIYWYAIRPLPKTSGEIAAPLSAAADVKRDGRGVPHIEAATWQDAIFLQGYVTAQDRLWQMDVLRRFAAGELAEVFGPAAVREDEHARRMRMRPIAEADAAHLSPEERELLVEYARGVNHFIDMHRGGYSLEFSLPGHAYDPRPWTITDSILVGLVMFRDLTDSAAQDLERGELLAAAKDPAKLRILFPPVQGGRLSPGSNAWAVSGAHTADGKPMVANDPHLSYGIPGTWHLVHLKAPGVNVSGGALPGVPGVITGHNSQIAWGVTNLQADVLDIYIEQIDEQTGRYLYQGHTEQAQLDTQTIAVRGGKPVTVNTWITRHGPVIAALKGRGYSMKWSAAEGFSFPFWMIDRARNWNDFRAALSTFWGPAQNFVFGDRAGNIGYQAAGRVPIRKGFDSNIPLDGTSGNYEWSGYIPFEQMPSVYNPPSGIVATANQNPFPPDYPYSVDGSYADPYRVGQIRSLLCAKNKLSVEDMLAVQKDVYSSYDSFLARQVVTASQRHGTGGSKFVDAAISLLRTWDGQMDKDEAAPMVTQLLSSQLATALLQLAVSRNISTGTPTLPRPFVVETLFRTRPAGWVPSNDWDAWLLQNLNAALEAGRRRQGSPVSKWRWGKMLHWDFQHPVGKQLPLVSSFFNIGPVPMSGSGTTVKQTTATLGPSERMVVDLGDLDKSVQNLPAGESGFVASGHYKDQWPAYYVGKSFPMEFGKIDAKEILHVNPAAESK
jgi:penicillin G amidase